MKKEEISNEEGGGLEGLGIEKGSVRGFNEMKEFGAFLGRDSGLLRWWRGHMGFGKDGDS